MNASRPTDLLIEASAGTGKTYALVARMVDQLRAGVEPRELVALTFSRAAAGEIFMRFVSALADNAAKSPTDARLLRKVISTQHLSMIGTLDSFLMRLVRSFPLELGLGGEVEILDDYAAKAARAAISFAILRRTDRATKKTFVDAFRLAMNREDPRGFIESYRGLITHWHKVFLAHPDPSAWGVAETIWPEGAPFPLATEADLADAAAALDDVLANEEDISQSNRLRSAWVRMTEWVRDYRASGSEINSLFEKIAGVDNFFEQPAVTFKYYKDYALFGFSASAIKQAAGYVLGHCIRSRLETARGLFALLAPFEAEYDRRVRSRGRVTFDDLPRLISRLGELDRLAIEFRMDAKIRAWALDEFQDTSREQWRALGNLVHEALADDQKETFVVGDRKQAIYGWRNGDVRIFARERSAGGYEVRALDESWRYGPEICEAVNRVFRSKKIQDECPSWDCAEHHTAVPGRKGYVRVVTAAGPRADDFIEPIATELEATRPWEKGLNTAILVRSNTFGEKLAKALKTNGILAVAWEGESAILDTPALRAFTDLVRLSEHPADAFAWTRFRLSPLARAWYGETVPADPAAVSAEFARLFTRRGLVRTFQALRARLPEDPAVAWSAFTESRYIDMLRAAAEFELLLEPGTRLSDFEAFLESRTKRDTATPGQVRIMTIHRSKGLTFDYVILPLYEPRGLGAGDRPLENDEPDWILPRPIPLVTLHDPVLGGVAEARREMDIQESLCIYYVAMTRARYAVSMIISPAPKTPSKVTRFADIVRESGLGDGVGAPDIRITSPAQGTVAPAPREAVPPVRGSRTVVRRRLPSRDFHDGMSAGELFRDNSARRRAMERGDAAHARFERIEFLSSATNDFERALLRPEGLVELWRERSFETLLDGEWMSGQFDRVVFTELGGVRRAVVYDFKTNRPQPNEPPEAFSERMRTTYSGQLAAYRRAVAHLTGIAPENISAFLLLTHTRSVI